MTHSEHQLTAADLMTIEPIVVEPEAPIEEAERLIRDYHVSGLPVVDSAGALVGVISQTDLVHLENPEVRALIRHASRGIRVGEVMSQPALTVLPSTPLLEAARIMAQKRVHRLVVVDDRQRPLGVLSAMDFVELFAEG